MLNIIIRFLFSIIIRIFLGIICAASYIAICAVFLQQQATLPFWLSIIICIALLVLLWKYTPIKFALILTAFMGSGPTALSTMFAQLAASMATQRAGQLVAEGVRDEIQYRINPADLSLIKQLPWITAVVIVAVSMGMYESSKQSSADVQNIDTVTTQTTDNSNNQALGANNSKSQATIPHKYIDPASADDQSAANKILLRNGTLATSKVESQVPPQNTDTPNTAPIEKRVLHNEIITDPDFVSLARQGKLKSAPFKIGDDMQSVLAAWGKPTKTVGTEGALSFVYPEYSVITDYQQKSVVGFHIPINMNQVQIKNTLGSPTVDIQQDAYDGWSMIYQLGHYRLTFSTAQDPSAPFQYVSILKKDE